MANTIVAPQSPAVEDPFGGGPENWSQPDMDWPPADVWEMAALDRWVSDCEREYFERFGNGDAE